MTVQRLLPVAVAISLLVAGSARAESLLDMYEAARAYDATWQSARAQYDANLYHAEQARAGILPQVGLGGNVARNWVETNVDQLPNSSFDKKTTAQQASLNGSQPLYRPANLAAWRQAQRQMEVAQYQLTAASQDLMIRVSQAYFDVLASQDTLAFVRAQKAATAEQLASAKRNFEVGTSTITDTREAQARYDLVVAQEIAAENDLRVKKLALDTLVGRNDVMPNPLPTPFDVPTPQPASPDAWVAAAEDASPAILQAKKGVVIAELETEKARAADKPTVDLTTSYSYTRNLHGLATSVIPNNIRTTVGAVGIAFNLPLFSGFAVVNRIRETLSLEEKARADLEAARRQVAQAVRTAYFGVVSGQNQVRALESAEASSQSALDANRLGYQVGVRINIDVLNAQSQLYQTKRDLSQARYNVLLGQLKLRQANGTLQEQDLERLNAIMTH